jgi:peptide/nickel transport system permease protein
MTGLGRLGHLARRSGQHWLGGIGGGILVIMALVAVLAPLIAPHDPSKVDLRARLAPPAWVAGGDADHLLGTDNVGRDILSRIIYGSRVSLAVGFTAVALGAVVGSAIGCLAGYFGRWLDGILSWLINVQLSFPFTLLAIFLLATFGGGFLPVVVVLALGSWVNYARIVRGQVITVRSQDYVEAAHAIGVGTGRILRRYVLPNTLSPIIVVGSFSMAQAILTEAALTFLGVGVDPTVPSWGGMLNDGRDYLQSAWWIATLPGVAIALTVLGGNLLGDWLRDQLDPRLRR